MLTVTTQRSLMPLNPKNKIKFNNNTKVSMIVGNYWKFMRFSIVDGA